MNVQNVGEDKMNKKQNLKDILHDFGITYLIESRESRNKAIDQAKTKIKSLMKLDVNEIEGFLEDNWNHLFNPEENYSGRLTLARQIRNFIEKKLGIK